jgi:proteasome lid subunit RPN8/RPN11
LQIASAAIGAIVHHARATAPHECCGLLFSRDSRIVEAVPARNVADDPVRRFVIDPADHFRARRAARAQGLDVAGFYHSHPTSPAEPSPRDLDEFSYTGHLYLIVSLRAEPAEIGLFRLESGNFRPVPFVTVA